MQPSYLRTSGFRNQEGRPLRMVASWLCALLFTLSWISLSQAMADAGKEEAQLQQIKGKIEGMRSDLSQRETQRNQLQDELQSTERSIGEAARRLKEINNQLQTRQQELLALELENGQNRRNLEAQQAVLYRQIRAAYAMGRQERLKILLNQQDPEIVSRMLVYYDYFNRARHARMGQIREMVEAVAYNASKLEEERRRLAELNEKELSEQALLEESRQVREQVLVALGQEISDKVLQLKELEKDEQRLQSLVNKLQEALVLQPLNEAEQQTFKTLKGSLRWPTKGQLAAAFGQLKGGNVRWDGVLISASEGAEVRAVHRGRVAFADWLRGFGLLVIVDHGSGYMTLYGHNQSLFKETGEWVEAGEPLALVGNSGGRADSGVYFGIRIDGKPVNPKKWCQRIKGRRISGPLHRDSMQRRTVVFTEMNSRIPNVGGWGKMATVGLAGSGQRV